MKEKLEVTPMITRGVEKMSRRETVEKMVKIIMGAISETTQDINPANYYEATIEAELLYDAGFRLSGVKDE